MFDKSLFPFDPEKMMEMFKFPDLAKMMSDMKLPHLDANELMAAQKKNMDALMEANKAAAVGYQELFKKQTEIFEETMSELRKQMHEFDAGKMPSDAGKQTELARTAFDKALANMTALAEAAQRANKDAMEIVGARIKESMEELQQMSKKLTG